MQLEVALEGGENKSPKHSACYLLLFALCDCYTAHPRIYYELTVFNFPGTIFLLHLLNI